LNNFYVQNTYLCVLLCSNYLTYMVSVCDNIYFAFALNIKTTVDGEEAGEQKLRVASFVSTFFKMTSTV